MQPDQDLGAYRTCESGYSSLSNMILGTLTYKQLALKVRYLTPLALRRTAKTIKEPKQMHREEERIPPSSQEVACTELESRTLSKKDKEKRTTPIPDP